MQQGGAQTVQEEQSRGRAVSSVQGAPRGARGQRAHGDGDGDRDHRPRVERRQRRGRAAKATQSARTPR
eukprot:3987285-Prymnesium_polylepis.1